MAFVRVLSRFGVFIYILPHLSCIEWSAFLTLLMHSYRNCQFHLPKVPKRINGLKQVLLFLWYSIDFSKTAGFHEVFLDLQYLGSICHVFRRFSKAMAEDWSAQLGPYQDPPKRKN